MHTSIFKIKIRMLMSLTGNTVMNIHMILSRKSHSHSWSDTFWQSKCQTYITVTPRYQSRSNTQYISNTETVKHEVVDQITGTLRVLGKQRTFWPPAVTLIDDCQSVKICNYCISSTVTPKHRGIIISYSIL